MNAQLPWQQMVPADRLHPNPDNPRQDPGDLDELAETIRSSGLRHRVLVIPAPGEGDGHYLIEDGWRRWLAMKDWMTLIPVEIRPARPGEDVHVRSILTALVTSAHQKPLNPVERAEGYGRLRDEFGLTQAQIAHQMGLSVSVIAKSLALLELSNDTLERVRNGSLPVGEALSAVYRRRAAVRRRKGGTGQTGAVWEPDWFTVKHPLAKQAAALCDGRGHNSRRRHGKAGYFPGACGECWESVVRADERIVAATAEASAAWHELAGNDSPAGG
jgi:ParB family transcriptional regulator, chromosome partitioning protein